MTRTLSPLEAISRTKKGDTLKTNVFIWGEGSHHHLVLNTRSSSLEPEALLLPSTFICRFRCSLGGRRCSPASLKGWWSLTPSHVEGILRVLAFTASGDKDPSLHVLIHISAPRPTLLQGKAMLWAELLCATTRVTPSQKLYILVEILKLHCFIVNCYSAGTPLTSTRLQHHPNYYPRASFVFSLSCHR